ncbi:MAG: hypothetical protein KIT35_14125 [Piscinibacter sp.]|uniref:hypothetical protein n=1 Tax=Piscinibacter sp. TaxID=1903157 RepID=UPI00258A191B|nr:hypothetical protein [Piscinibacter sp.]MCW5664971.1 hypothetical protein [Piscinibacter sp.]
MRTLPWMIAAAALAAATHSSAQPGPRGPGMAASAASAPGPGPGRMGGGMGGGMMGRRFGPDNTPGWAMMTPAERTAHRDRMWSFKTEGECRAYLEQHHQQMAERAKERGRSVPANPRRDPCAGLPK